MRILVVDDDPLFCDLMSMELAACGYTDVHIVNSGAEAIDLVREPSRLFSCALLDIDMPGMNGIELCRALRAEVNTSDIPIVMVTARSEIESVDEAFAAGATDYLTKPLNRRELQGRMTMASGIARERAARQAALLQKDDTRRLHFADTFRLEMDYSCLDYLALQNYVLKLGAMSMFSQVAIGFQVANARQLFMTLDNSTFQDSMSDIAEIIAEALIANDAILSYAGSGTFVALAKRVPEISVEDLTDQLEVKLLTLNEWYANLGQMPTLMKIGSPITRGIVNLSSATEVLETALENANASKAIVGAESGVNLSAALEAQNQTDGM